MTELCKTELLGNKNKFLLQYNARSNFESENFIESGLTWEDLIEIVDDYVARNEELKALKMEYLNQIQDLTKAHSIKARIKNPERLVEKIIRKVARDGIRIDKTNYLDKITDIVGLKIIHISRFDSISLFNQIYSKFKEQFIEDVKIKIRAGDEEHLFEPLKSFGVQIEKQKRYRSIHYTLKAECGICVEIQTRTLFEEGWSELDHDVIYKGSKVSKRLELYSTILSRLVGVCDDIAELMWNDDNDAEFSKLTKDHGLDKDFLYYLLRKD